MDRRNFLKTCGKAWVAVKATPFWIKKEKKIVTKNIIEYHYYLNPDTTWLTDQTRFNPVNSLPLDGTAISVETGGGVNFTESIFSVNYYGLNDLAGSLLRHQTRLSLGYGRVRNNFLAILTEPSTRDWFSSEIGSVLHNFDTAGQFVTRAGLYGIYFDHEEYSSRLWQYSSMPLKTRYSFAEYEAQVYKCAKIIGESWLRSNPSFKLFLGQGYSIYYNYVDLNPGVPQDLNEYGLYKAFLNGLFDAFGEGKNNSSLISPSFPRYYAGTSDPEIIVHTLDSYQCKTGACLDTWLATVTGSSNSRYKGDSIYFDDIARFGLAIALDYNGLGSPSFDPLNPGSNYFTPAEFKESLGLILDRVDWAFIFLNTVAFYEVSASAPNGLVPDDYIEVIREVRSERGMY